MFVFSITTLLFFIPKTITAETEVLRILGGRNATEGEFPYIVVIVRLFKNAANRNTYERVCSGAAITSKWTLTAAHCDYGAPSLAIMYDKKFATISNFVSHPKYPLLNYDIALLNHNHVEITEYGRLSAIEYSALYGQEAMCAGHGGYERSPKPKGNPKDKSKSQYLYKKPAGLMLLNCLIVECAFNIDVHPRICVTVSCNERPKIRSIAPGDSGGPLVHESGIVGIASAVGEGESQGYAGYYVPITYFVGWIRNEMKTAVRARPRRPAH